MKLIQKRSKKSLVIIFIAAALLITAGLSYYVFALNGSLFGWQYRQDTPSPSQENVNLDPPTDEEKQTGTSTKEQAIEKANTPSNGDNNAPLPVNITATNQNEDILQIRSMIDTLIPNGSCTLTLTKDSQTVTKTAQTYPTASISTCQGFDVPTSELSAGTWNVKIEVNAEGKRGQATTTVQIN